jgi:hypothetical protein
MAQGQRLTDEQIETIRLTYAETGFIVAAAREAGCSESAARKYCHAPDDDLTELRAEKRADVITKLAEVRLRYLDHMLDDKVIAETSARDAVIVVGTLTDKHQLLIGAATSRSEVLIRQQAEVMAAELGVPVDEILEEASAVAAGSWDSWSPQ